MKKICVLGDGAWGTALAQLLATNNNPVYLWCYNTETAQEISTCNTNFRYLPSIPLSPLIYATKSLQEALVDAEYIFEAIPVQFLRSIIQQARASIKPEQKWILLSKGLENKSLLFPSEILKNMVGFEPTLAVISGPSFALDLSQQQPTAVNIASTSLDLIEHSKLLLENNFFSLYPIQDILGMQICAAFKNVIALAVGIAHGMNYKDNTRALIIHRGITELRQILALYSCPESTVLELCGVGDIMLTCSSLTSRNIQVGKLLGQGQNIETILSTFQAIPESINSLHSFYAFSKQFKIVSFTYHLYRSIYHKASFATLLGK